ncbi:MAG TPA: hypothetical protein VFA66_07010 [Gaiellaceae bacterium]|nr:hypothetical protein [Gaiellaceae bacterium]
MSARKFAAGLAPAFGLALAAAAHPASSTPLDGVWRISWTAAELRAAGANTAYARGNQGVLTMTLHSGRLRFHFRKPPDCGVAFRLTGHTFLIPTFRVPTCPGGQGGSFSARWTLRGKQLWFSNVHSLDPGDGIFWTRKPWVRIG